MSLKMSFGWFLESLCGDHECAYAYAHIAFLCLNEQKPVREQLHEV